MEDAALQAALERFLTSRCAGPVRVEGLRPLAGGASREIYGFELHEQGRAPRALVLRLDPDSGRMHSDRGEEFALLAAARAAGVTVPVVHWLGEVADGLGARFIVMDRVAGQAIARRLLRDDAFAATRNALPGDLSRELARIHAIDLGDERIRPLVARAPAGDDPKRFALAEIERYRQLLDLADHGHPRPALRFGGRWLSRHAPSCARAALVHGDFRVGNVLFDERGLTAVLDWELAHLGDPLEDLGWLSVRAWRFGRDELAVGGLCTRDRFRELYEQAVGARIDESAWRWWEIFGNWKWAIICVMQAASHEAGRFPNVELASLGRRTAEVEWEMIVLIEQSHVGSS